MDAGDLAGSRRAGTRDYRDHRGALHPGASIGKNKAFIDEAATTELTSQAGSKACNVLAHDGTEFDKWAAKARSALTGKALKEFNEYLPTQKQLIEQTKAVAD